MMKLFHWRAAAAVASNNGSSSSSSSNNKQQLSSSSSNGTPTTTDQQSSDAIVTLSSEERDDSSSSSKPLHHLPASPDTTATSSSCLLSSRSLTSVSDGSTISLERRNSDDASYSIDRGLSLYGRGEVVEAQACWEQVWGELGTMLEFETDAAGQQQQQQSVQSLRVKVLVCLLYSYLRPPPGSVFWSKQSDQTRHNDKATHYVSQLAKLANEVGDYKNDCYTVADQLLLHSDVTSAELDALWKVLMDGQHWQLALQLAIRRETVGGVNIVSKTWIDPITLARVYYKVALLGDHAQKSIDSLKTCLTLLPKRASPSTAALRRSALECLVDLEGSRSHYDAALFWHARLLKTFPSNALFSMEFAKVQYQVVKVVYIPRGHVAMAVKHLNNILQQIDDSGSGANVSEKDSAEDSPMAKWLFRLELLQVKAGLEVQRSNWNAALHDYQEIVQLMEQKGDVSTNSPDGEDDDVSGPDVLAKLFYTLGRLCVKLSKYDDAIRYFTQELNITREVVGPNSLAVSRILHELAAIYEDGLGDNDKALALYQDALRIEEVVIKECKKAAPHRGSTRAQRQLYLSITTPCLQDAIQQRRDTQRCIGRVHFKCGDFNRALQLSFPSAVGMPK